MTIINQICQLLVLTKSCIFKHFASKILLIILILATFSSFNQPCQVPVYYTFETPDGVTHKWSREVYNDIYGNISETADQVYKRWADQESKEDITFFWSEYNYHKSMKSLMKVAEIRMDSIITWRTHENYKLSLDKYCIKIK